MGTKKQLLVKPGVFQADDTVDPEAFHFGFTHSTYGGFISKEEEKAKFPDPYIAAHKKKKHPFFQIPNLLKCGYMRCPGCGNYMIECHDVVFGPFCLYEVIEYCNEYIEHVDDTIVRKFFIDTYNCCLKFVTFKERKDIHKDWVFPPKCMQHNSYNYMLFWYMFIVEGDRTLGFSDIDVEFD